MRERRVGRWVRRVIGLALCGVAAGGLAWWYAGPRGPVPLDLTRVATATVRRADLDASLTAGGTVESSSRTVIECELEAIDIGVRGQTRSGGGASTILSIMPEGSHVRKGDTLCILDSSEYEEMARQQQMNVDRAHADFRAAELNLDVARLAVGEYRDGLMRQKIEALEGAIALAKSDRERAEERLTWTRRMMSKGYSAKTQVANDEYQVASGTFKLEESETALDIFRRFSAPVYLKILESEIKAAESSVSYLTRRVQRTEERLNNLNKQVALCTIHAPHDGMLIYANEDMRQIRIEPGTAVRQKQRLFYLPDLSRIEVETLLHETVVRDVKPGMRAKIRIEALSDQVLEGRVSAIAQLPDPPNWRSDVRYFTGTVRLDHPPGGLKPGMSAEVEIQTIRRPDVLTVPTEALAVESGRDVCYVAQGDHLERRPVKLGYSTRSLLEVTDGLEEGEQVVLDPTHLDGSVAVTETPAEEPDTPPAPVPTGTNTDS